MQIRLSPSMKSINISTSSNGFFDLMKVKVAARHISYRTLFHTVLFLAFLLPFVFILTAVVTLEGVNKCSSFDCLGRRLGPRFLSRGTDDSARFLRDLYTLLDHASSLEIPDNLKFPDSYKEFLLETNNNLDANTFAVMLKGTMEHMNREAKRARLAEQLHKHYAAISIPKGLHCLSLRLTDEYSSNAHARKQLPPPELLPLLSNNSYYHFIVATDNILAASVVVNSAARSSMKPEMMVFHIITDKKTYPAMHSWFALNPISPAIIELKGIHQFNWLTRENVPVIEAIESHHHVRDHYHKSTVIEANISDNPRVFASRLQVRSPKYISLLNHLRIYLPEMFPRLDKVVFLDDDVVVQRDLTRLWDIELYGKVNGAVETCRGEDSWVMSKRFRTYFNFSHPLISKNLNPEECAWAYGMNIFDLKAWRKTDIRETYHHWMKEVITNA